MKYSVTGGDKNTGDERTVVISATDKKDAERQARQMGLLVSEVLERGEYSGAHEPYPVPATKKLISAPGLPQQVLHKGAAPLSYNQDTIIIILLLIGIGAPFFGELKSKPKWEYTIDSPTDTKLDDDLEKMGDDGWELVFARRAITGSGEFAESNYEMIFKQACPQTWQLP